MTRLRRAVAIAAAALSLWGCDDPRSVPDTACGELVCSVGGKADTLDGIDAELVVDQPVQWSLSLQREPSQPAASGRIRLSFFGGRLPLSHGGALAPNAPSFLQPAVLEVTKPSFDDPTRIETYEFLALLQSWDGQSYSLDPIDGQGALLSTSLPDAVERFNDVYDPVTRRGEHTARVDGTFGFSTLQFVPNGSGGLEVGRIAIGFAELGGDTIRRERLTTGPIPAELGAATGATAAFFTDQPVVDEGGGSMRYFIEPGTLRVLPAHTLREAADMAGVYSDLSGHTVGVFEQDGVFAVADLRANTGINPFIAWLGVYAPDTVLRPVGPDAPLILVDRARAHFAFGLADLRPGQATVQIGLLR